MNEEQIERNKYYTNILCVNEYNKDIPFTSYYYKLRPNLKEIIIEHKSEKDFYDLLSKFIDISINVLLLQKDIFDLLIELIKNEEDNEVSILIVKVFCKILRYHLVIVLFVYG